MARWIAFDQETSSLLRAALTQGTRIETLLRGPVDYALARPSAVVTVLPASGSGELGIAVFRPARHLKVAPPQAGTAERRSALPPRGNRSAEGTRAGGFLGLSDEVVVEDDIAQGKKGWWRKFWDE
jgi:hypothetical protein